MGSRSTMNNNSNNVLTEEGRAALANRERAYIAASRRKDRSDEARLESALRGSEIHKQLTGKALIITREIVMNGGEYLEEDPAFERLLARRRQSAESPTMASPTLEAFMNRQFHDNRVQFVSGFPQQQGGSPSAQVPHNPMLQSTKEEDDTESLKVMESPLSPIHDDMGSPQLHHQHLDEHPIPTSINPQLLQTPAFSYGDIFNHHGWIDASSEPLVFLGQHDLDSLLTQSSNQDHLSDSFHDGLQDGLQEFPSWENEDNASNFGHEHLHF